MLRAFELSGPRAQLLESTNGPAASPACCSALPNCASLPTIFQIGVDGDAFSDLVQLGGDRGGVAVPPHLPLASKRRVAGCGPARQSALPLNSLLVTGPATTLPRYSSPSWPINWAQASAESSAPGRAMPQPLFDRAATRTPGGPTSVT